MSKGFRIFTSIVLILLGAFIFVGGISLGGVGGAVLIFLTAICVLLLLFVNKKPKDTANVEPDTHQYTVDYNQNVEKQDLPDNRITFEPKPTIVQPVAQTSEPLPVFPVQEVRDDVKLCPKCKMEIPKKATMCPHCQSRIGGFSLSSVLAAVVIIIIVIVGIGTIATSGDKSGGDIGTVHLEGKCSTEVDEFGVRYYTGTIRNDTSRNYTYVDVTIGFYDENGVKLGSGLDNVLNLGSGETWKFSVVCMYDNAKSAKVENIDFY